MDFLKQFDKELEKVKGITTTSEPPRYWFGSGNYVLNRIMSGSFYRAIPQGRITTLVGGSGTGKSFLAANFAKQAQSEGAFVLIIDSENAMDDEFMTGIGVDVNNNYKYVGITTVGQLTSVISSFLSGYRESVGTDLAAPKVVIIVDSLGMLITETQLEHYEKGDQKGDQGQKNKQIKHVLKTLVHDVKGINVSLICTDGVYKNQDVLNGEGLWIVSEATKWSASQIVLLSKLKLKDKEAGNVAGIRMKCEGYKVRFTKPYQTVTIEVPYDTGMDPYSGLLEVAMAMGVIQKKGSRYFITGSEDTWYAKDIDKVADQILEQCEKLSDIELSTDADIDDSQNVTTAQRKREKFNVESA